MHHIDLICVGNCKEPYLQQGCQEYQKRLLGHCKLRIVECAEHRLSENPSQSEIEQGILKEGKSLQSHLNKGWSAALCIEGTPMDSQAFSKEIVRQGVIGNSQLHFIIGGSHGLSPEIKQQADLRFSLSAMTFPHQLARLMLLEQLYRAFQIAGGGKYHK